MLSPQNLNPAPSTKQDPNERCKHATLITELLLAKYSDFFHKTMPFVSRHGGFVAVFKGLIFHHFSVFLSRVTNVSGHILHPNQAPVGSSAFHPSVMEP